MKHLIRAGVITCFSLFLSVQSVAAATVTISDCTELENITGSANATDTLVLDNDIDCSGVDFTSINFGGGFQGVFDGQGFTISNLVAEGDGFGSSGLFASASGATFRDVSIVSSTITHSFSNQAGALVASATNTTIERVTSTANVTGGTSYAGGLVGRVFFTDDSAYTWTNISVGGSVEGSNALGGIAGYVQFSTNNASFSLDTARVTTTISDSTNGQMGGFFGQIFTVPSGAATSTITITNGSMAGNITRTGGSYPTGGIVGLFGISAGGTVSAPVVLEITSTTVSGDISSVSNDTGGLIGQVYFNADVEENLLVQIENNVVNNDITSTNYGGGIIGRVSSFESGVAGERVALIMQYNTSTGSIAGEDYTGGVIGYLDGADITHASGLGGATIQKNASTRNVSGDDYVGGFVGYVDCSSINTSLVYPCQFSSNYTSGITVDGDGTVGGFAGRIVQGAQISNSYANATSEASFNNIGGFAGGVVGTTTVSNIYAIGSVDAADVEGGLIGYVTNGSVSIEDSFSATEVDDGGGAFGTVGGGVTVSDIYFDETETTQTNCKDGAVVAGCTAVNTSGSPSASYFFNNETNPPLDSWNFNTVWKKEVGTYPTLIMSEVAPDSTAPIISSISISSLLSTGVTIGWTTDESGTSVVSYGTTDGYGSTATGTSGTNHSVTLTGLSSCTQYHYQVSTTDASDNTATSTDNTFTTSGCPDNESSSSQGGNTYTSDNPLTRDILQEEWFNNESDAHTDDEEQDGEREEEEENTDDPTSNNADQPLQCDAAVYLTTSIRFGAENNPADVRLLEEFLNTYENAGLEINGEYEQADVNAVIAWQEKHAADILEPWGIDQGTGFVYTTSLEKIKEIHEANCATQSTPSNLPTDSMPVACLLTNQSLVDGMNNEDVVIAQALLKKLGFFPENIDTTGYYGPITRDAVVQFQAAYSIDQVGIIGPQTRTKLNDVGC